MNLRICRGSIVARQREEATKFANELYKKQAEEKNELIRKRLKVAFLLNKEENDKNVLSFKETTLNSSEFFNLTKKSKFHSLARVAGPIRQPYKSPILDKRQTNYKKKNQSSNLLLQTINTKKFTNDKNIYNFKHVSFEPIKSNKNELQATKVVPQIRTTTKKGKQVYITSEVLINNNEPLNSKLNEIKPIHIKLNDGQNNNTKFSEATPMQQNLTKLNFSTKINTEKADCKENKEKKKSKSYNSNLQPLPINKPTLNTISIQTDPNLIFDKIYLPIISNLVNTAISVAVRSLEEEEKRNYIEEINVQLQEGIEEQKNKNFELKNIVNNQYVTQQELIKEKKAALLKLEILESYKIAEEQVAFLTDKSIEELSSKKLIQDIQPFRSVAADTRDFENDINLFNQKTAQISKDFFPYVYAKAERIFVEKLTANYLKDALFASDKNLRQDAQNLLNKQIQKYNKMTNLHKEKLF